MSAADRGPEPVAATDTGETYDVVMLDAGPMGYATHPRRDIRQEAARWLAGLFRAGVRVAVPEVADYEQRRELLRIRSHESVTRLDELGEQGVYLPITTPVMRRAAALWAEARNAGLPTADPKELDGDVILAAQAQVLGEEIEQSVIVATTNPGHLSRFVAAADWQDIGPATERESEPEDE